MVNLPVLSVIDPTAYDRGDWLWDHVRKQENCFDDFSCDAKGPILGIFAARLADSRCIAFEVGDAGLILVEQIVPRLAGNIHFFAWGDIPLSVGREAIAHVMDAYSLRRLTGAIPEYNRLAKRIATELGFLEEGRLRQAFLKHRRYWDVLLFGLVREDE